MIKSKQQVKRDFPFLTMQCSFVATTAIL